MKIPLAIIALVCGSGGLIYAKSVLIPFLIALFISYILAPLVQIIQDKLKCPRPLALGMTGILVICGVVLLGIVLSANIKGMIAHFDSYAGRIDLLIAKVSPLLEFFGIGDLGLLQDDLASAIKPLFSFARIVSTSMLDLLADSFLILIFVLFLLSGSKFELPDTPFFAETDKRIRSYLVTKVITSLVTGILTGLVLWLIGMELAFLFGLLAFILNFIPTVGSVAAVIIPMPVALLALESPLKIGLAFLIPMTIQFVVGNLVEPKLMGDNLDLHPVTLLLALMFWGLIWGVPGMLLAAPLTVIAKVAISRSQNGKFLSELMAGRIAV
jgi:AI-2 transport protein TqsA